MARTSKYKLDEMGLGEERTFNVADAKEAQLIRRSAHNLNQRTGKYFLTRYRDGVLSITRLK